jgi:WD40 repeat protein
VTDRRGGGLPAGVMCRVGVLTDPHSNGVYWAAVSPDGRMLATADGNGSTYLWALTVRKAR